MTVKDLYIGSEIGFDTIKYLCSFYNKEGHKTWLFVCESKKKPGRYKVYRSDEKGTLYFIKKTSFKAALIYCWNSIKSNINLSY